MNEKYNKSLIDLYICGVWIKVREDSAQRWTAFIVSDREQSIAKALWESEGHIYRHLAVNAAMEAIEHKEVRV